MRSRPTFWILFVLLCVGGAWLFWPRTGNRVAEPPAAPQMKTFVAPVSTTVASAAATPNIFATTRTAAALTNDFAYRLSNTARSIGELARDQKAILLENVLIDARLPLNLSIPKNLQSAGDPGAYIVQAKGTADAPFRAQLAAAGAQIVSYIPNNAYLVEVSPGGAQAMASGGLLVIPYEPYYKVPSSLLTAILKHPDRPLAVGVLKVAAYPGTADQVAAALPAMGLNIVAQDPSPFGRVFTVQGVGDVAAVARLAVVQRVEPYHARVRANDLSRATTGVAADSTTTTNYLNLSGSNVLVQVNDTGIDPVQPDLVGRVFGVLTNDTVGHGTHVAGIIAGNGTESLTVTNASGSVNPGTNFQYRGMAPLAKLFAMDFEDSDQNLQQGAALTNALISNNSWNFVGDPAYDLEAASYDAATRDALPLVTGSQGVLFVFSAGNAGGGQNNGVGGGAGSILSPATAKNVIAVGALEQLRNITNIVTDANGTSNEVWFGDTDSDTQVAGFSSRGNVGIGTEGTTGRYKPDVVAPGTFVVSTRSTEWDQTAYYYQSPTNHDTQVFNHIVVQPGSVWANSFPLIPDDALQVTIQVVANADSPVPFPNLPIYMGLESAPGYAYLTTNNLFSIPPDGPGLPAIIADQNLGFNYAVSNSTANPVNFDVITDIITTNGNGDYFQVLSNLNNNLGPWYRYESGTSMAAGDVSGLLALMQDYFTNTLHTTPSPVLLKALLVNGARAVGNYNFHETDGRNYQGWGLINLPNSVPAGSTNPVVGSNSVFYLDQSVTNALATGDRHTFQITVPTNSANLPLRVTLAWTDPPGNPAAAIKLVNNLDLIVTNLDNPTNIVVYYGNDIPPGTIYNAQGSTNAPNLDTINNLENVFLQPALATNYSVTVVGRGVNVNAVTAQTNNVVQDYALVISCGDALAPGAITVTDLGNVSNPTSAQLITAVVSTNSPLFNQFVGANTPLLGTNTVGVVTTNRTFATNALITVGMTNQWHFYVVTNTGANNNFTNAAFVTFLPPTLAIPRMGVFASTVANATTPEADIDLYVASLKTDANAASLTNLDPTVISNCVNGLNGDAASLSRGGTEFVVFTNSAVGQVYYVGVKSEAQMASDYAFLPVFTDTPFSQLNPDGSETVNGIPLPVTIPDGSPLHPGAGYVFGLALYPIDVENVIVSNQVTHQNFGDLIGVLTHNGKSDVLNNHASLGNPPGPYTLVYDDSQYPVANSRPSDGPGSLNNFIGQQGVGAWILTEVDDSQSQTGAVTGFNMLIQPHLDPSKGGVTVALAPGQFFTTYVDVPVGAVNLTVAATNITATPAVQPVQLFVKFGSLPTLADTNLMVLLTNGTPPGNLISTGPPLTPGRYFIGLFNPPANPTQTVFLIATLSFSASAATTVDFNPSGPAAILDDAVTYSSIFVPNTDAIQGLNVGLRVDHPRISDLVFHLISPDGTRFLLMENRGGTTTNGAGITVLSTNIVPVNSAGGPEAVTNTIDTGTTSGTFSITYNFYTAPDQMVVYYGTTLTPANLILDTGYISNPPGPGGPGPQGTNTIPQTITLNYPPASATGTSTEITIIMNPGGNTFTTNTLWTYTVSSTQAKYYYLTLTENTNLTTTPIKFAPPPFTPVTSPPVTNLITVWSNSFEGTGISYSPVAGDYFAGGWHVDSGDLDVLTTGTFGSTAYEGNYYIDINGNNPATISTNVATVPGQTYTLNFAYSKNPVGGDHTVQLLQNTNVLLNLTVTTNNSWESLGWATTSVVFNATSPVTAITFASQTDGAYGVLLDAVYLYSNSTSSSFSSNLYYQPEQDISALTGTSARDTWQLEIQDNRAGAGLTNTLVSWQLEMVFANTNFTITPPIITTPATGITFTDATLNALVYPNGVATTVYFEYGTNTSYGLFSTSVLVTNNLALQQALGIAVTNLMPDTLYHFQAISTNSTGTTNFGGDLTFFSHIGPLPYAATLPASMVTGSSARLNGMATPNALPSAAWFEWGTNTLYGNQTTPVNVGAGNNVVYTNSQITGLVTNVPYHFRLVVSNAFAVVYGFDQVLDEAYVVAWGADYAGQINVPTNLNNVVAIAGAYDHSLALKTNGLVVAWGDNTFGQTSVPSSVSNVVAVAGGQYYSMALNSSGTVASWGASLLNQTNVPPGLSNVVAIAGGTYSSLALQNDGTVVAWGASFFGLTNVPAGASNTVAIAGGAYHSLALKNDGTVMVWGDNSSGQTNVPAGLSNVVAIAAGSYHSLALKSDGTVVAWGDNGSGQTNVPAGLSNVVAVAAGGFHSLALKSNGTVVAWGDPSAGQTTVPTGLSNVVAIASGYLHSLALTPQSISSLTNPVVFNLTNGLPQTNTVLAGGVIYYQVNVPTNADFATNSLLFALNGPLNVWFSTNSPPTIGTVKDSLLLAGVTNGISILNTNGLPALVPGSTYYLGVNNTNSFTVTYGVEVNFHLVIAPLPQTNTVPISSIVYTNIGVTNGFLLTWFAPSNDLFQVQWTTNLAPANWRTFTNPATISYNTNFPVNPTNAQFNFFDDGSQTGGLGSARFYRLILLNGALPANTLVLPPQTNLIVSVSTPVTVTNTATDSNTNAILTYSLLNSPPNASISTNGIIFWTNATPQGLAARFTTLVTDNGATSAMATNAFTVFVAPFPSISSVTFTNNGLNLQWFAPTNNQFNVQWTTNLAPPAIWTYFPNNVSPGIITSTSGTFSFTDTNALFILKFYRLILLP
jgi:subtilisin-like proprotein convertase family protein